MLLILSFLCNKPELLTLMCFQSVEEGQGSSEETACVTPRLLSSSEMRSLLQWEDSESHPLTELERLITVLLMQSCANMSL